jgi:hypothetical protein
MPKQVDAPVVMERSEMFAISPAEAVAKAKEDNKRLASKSRITDQDILEDHEAAQGIELHHNELIRRIQLLNPKILIMPGGINGAVAVRYPKFEFGEWSNTYITGFYLQPLPEFSSVTTDANGLPHREIRGWRSVLLALIKAGALDRKKVDALFGPARGQRSGIWYRTLQSI